MKSARSLTSQQSSTALSENGVPATDLEPSPTFITVRYGENKNALFTTWCPVHTLTECIRKKCCCDQDITLDLVDLQGHIRDLHMHPNDYAQHLVDGRKTYVLIKVEKQGEDEPAIYTSLLDNLEDHYPDLKGKLNNVSSTAPKPTIQKKGSKWTTLKTVARMTSRGSSVKSRGSNKGGNLR